MREALRRACQTNNNVLESVPHHVGLAYNAWAPIASDGQVPDDEKQGWFDKLVELKVHEDYECAYDRWRATFDGPPNRTADFKLTSRLLIGHGASSATDVGLTVHHTWGVPIMPGSALKGLCAHYMAFEYGPDEPSAEPWTATGEDAERLRYQAPKRDGKRILSGPGDVHRALFGAPDAQNDQIWRQQGKRWKAGAERGGVIFHDALYIPGSASSGGADRPYAQDVLTVHQKDYYDAPSGEEMVNWPNDFGKPYPIPFLTVRPGASFLLALSGPDEELALATHILKEALVNWGIGGKTSLEYGRGYLNRSWQQQS